MFPYYGNTYICSQWSDVDVVILWEHLPSLTVIRGRCFHTMETSTSAQRYMISIVWEHLSLLPVSKGRCFHTMGTSPSTNSAWPELDVSILWQHIPLLKGIMVSIVWKHLPLLTVIRGRCSHTMATSTSAKRHMVSIVWKHLPLLTVIRGGCFHTYISW